MCAIVDANVLSEIFGASRTDGGVAFLKWVDDGKGVLVWGGKLRIELSRDSSFRQWAREALFRGKLRLVADESIDSELPRVKFVCKSNDQHVIALARASGARLLYTNDKDLKDDFENTQLVNRPAGSCYPTVSKGTVTPSMRKWLRFAECSR